MRRIAYHDISGIRHEIEDPKPTDVIECINLSTTKGPMLLIETDVGTLFVQNCGLGRYVVYFSDSGKSGQRPQWGKILDPEYINSTQKLTYFDDNGQENAEYMKNTATLEKVTGLCLYFLETSRFPKGTLWEGGDMSLFADIDND